MPKSEMPQGSKCYRKKPVTVRAIQLFKPFEVFAKEGKLIGKAGDYLVEEAGGELYPCDKETFEEIYEEV